MLKILCKSLFGRKILYCFLTSQGCFCDVHVKSQRLPKPCRIDSGGRQGAAASGKQGRNSWREVTTEGG